MDSDWELSSLNAIKYLYLRRLLEPRDNSLRIIVDEAVPNPSKSVRIDRPELTSILKQSSPIETSEVCKSFELSWDRYVAYLVTEETVGSCGKYDDESYSGKLFRVYMKSHFLDHLTRDTGAHEKPIQHYKVICLNHLIDVASYNPPEIREIAAIPPASPAIH